MPGPSSIPTACPACGAPLRSALVCESCGRLLESPRPPTPFEALGLEAAQTLDLAAARRRLLALSRSMHPDYHARADERTRRLAQDNTATLNAAFSVLGDEARRADWLVRSLDGPGEDEERSMPGEFLQEVLEWNEAIEHARAAPSSAPAHAELDALAQRLRAERERSLEAVSADLTPLPPRGSPALRAVRRRLNAVRYIERALQELGELRLARA